MKLKTGKPYEQARKPQSYNSPRQGLTHVEKNMLHNKSILRF